MVVVGVARTPDWIGDWRCSRCGVEIRALESYFQWDRKIDGAHDYWFSCLDCARELGLLW